MVKASFLALGLVGAANAYITGIIPRTSPFKVKANSHLPLTFSTEDHIIQNYDYTIAVGIAPISDNVVPPQMGEQILQAYNLFQLGHASTGHGNFTVQVKLTKDQVSNYQPGQFVITAVATSGFGIFYGTSARFFNETVELQW